MLDFITTEFANNFTSIVYPMILAYWAIVLGLGAAVWGALVDNFQTWEEEIPLDWEWAFTQEYEEDSEEEILAQELYSEFLLFQAEVLEEEELFWERVEIDYQIMEENQALLESFDWMFSVPQENVRDI